SVVWELLPEGQGRSIASPLDRALDQLLKQHPEGGFMVKVYGDPSREMDWLIVPPRSKRSDGGEPGPDDGSPGPRYGETPPTAPQRDGQAAPPPAAEQLPELLATQEPEGQRIDAQAAGAPAGNDGVTTVSDRLHHRARRA